MRVLTSTAAVVTPRRAATASAPRPMTVAATYPLASDVLGIDLAPQDMTELPVWTPGARVTVRLPHGLQRCYSLCGDPADRGHYRIGVRRDRTRAEAARGCTPLLSPARSCTYQARTTASCSSPPRSTCFLPAALASRHQGDDRIAARAPAIAVGLHRAQQGHHGVPRRTGAQVARPCDRVRPRQNRRPTGCGADTRRQHRHRVLLRTRVDDRRGRRPRRTLGVHVERFTATSQSTDHARRPIEVTCNRSRTRVHVSESQSLLEALELARLPVYSYAAKESAAHAKCESSLVTPSTWTRSGQPGQGRAGHHVPLRLAGARPTLTLDI